MKKPLLLSSILLFIAATVYAQPANNLCASATNITTITTACGSPTSGTLYQSTTTGSPTNTYGSTYDVWYRFTAPAGVSTVQITLTSRGSLVDKNSTFIEAFNANACGTIATTTSLGTAQCENGLTVADLTPGAQYYFRIFSINNPSASSANWTYSVCVSYQAAPGNNDCAGATTLTMNAAATSARVSNATASSGIPVGCALGTPDDDVWFRFIASGSTANVTVNPGSTLGASGATIQLFSGACGSLVSVACGTRGSVYATGLTSGNTYFVRVYSFGAAGTNPVAGPSNGSTFNIIVTNPQVAQVRAGRMREIYQQTNLSDANMLNDPWEITYGPDGFLWITEAKGYRVYRMNPTTGARTTVLDISNGSTFFSAAADRDFNIQFDHGVIGAQGGLAGLALHPKFMDATSPINYVYISYIKNYEGTAPGSTGVFFTNAIIRLTYNSTTGKLESPTTICDTLPGSSDHNSQRMIIAPVTTGGTPYLFYAAGDMGAGQFGNRLRPNHAQDTTIYEGKILRFNLDATGSGTGFDPWIPNDNPYSTGSKKSAVWITGVRNNQGFAYDVAKNILYGSSHGPYSDDEINIIERKRNYGHPLIIGWKSDNNYVGSSAGAYAGGSSCPVIVSESYSADSIDIASPTAKYKDPIYSAYAPTAAEVNDIYKNNPNNNGIWPSEGWSGMDYCTSNLIPGWKNSIVIGSLKWGRVLRFKTNSAGTAIVPTGGQDTVSYFGSTNRYRDLAFSPDGKDMFVIMDKSATTSGPSAGNPIVPACGGCVQKYTFLGYADSSNRSTIPTVIDVTAGTAGTCTAGTTININSANNNLWVPITGPDGNVMAEIKANGQNLGDVTSSFYKNGGALRVTASKRYLDRNITITPAIQPSSQVDVRLYLSKSEFDVLKADPLSMVDTITDLKIMKNNDLCRSNLVAATTFITVDYAAPHGANGYVVQGKVSSFSSFYFSSSPVTLPVELLAFKGTLVDNSTVLDWQTTNERNAQKFVVERSIDGRTFEAIGTVAAHGNTTQVLDYTFTDVNAANQSSATLYYRLQMVDMDGKFKYSNTITISLADIVGKLTLAPNPASLEVKATITAVAEGRAKWQLIDNSGRVVLSGTVQLKTGKNVLPININSLKGGVYYLILSGAGVDQKVKLQKI